MILTMIGLYADTKYLKWYCNFTSNSNLRNRKKYKKSDKRWIYYEKHHIIPRCLGGNDDEANIILVTPKEHFILHLLLAKITGDEKLKKTVFLMSKSRKRIAARWYEKYRIDFSNSQSKLMKMKMKNGHSSPFANSSIHMKCMKTRIERASNIFITSNPMKNKSFISKKVMKCSGENNYAIKRNLYLYRYSHNEDWRKYKGPLSTLLDMISISSSTFWYAIKTQLPLKKGKNKGFEIRVIYENQEN